MGKIKGLAVALLLFGCGSKNSVYTLDINNLSDRQIDSVQVVIRSSQGGQAGMLFGNIPSSQNHQQVILQSLVNARHDIGLWTKAYLKDTIIESGSYYDLPFFCDHYKMTIDSSLKTSWTQW